MIMKESLYIETKNSNPYVRLQATNIAVVHSCASCERYYFKLALRMKSDVLHPGNWFLAVFTSLTVLSDSTEPVAVLSGVATRHDDLSLNQGDAKVALPSSRRIRTELSLVHWNRESSVLLTM